MAEVGKVSDRGNLHNKGPVHSKQSFKPEEHCKLILDGLLLLELAEDQSKEASNSFFLLDLNQSSFDDCGVSLGDHPIELVCIVRL